MLGTLVPAEGDQAPGGIHPFERLGSVFELHRQTGTFHGLTTETVGGLPRPPDDEYAANLAHS